MRPVAFDATSLRPPPPSHARTFLLLGDGYSKEMDINSASPDAVEPLPWHAMPAYPYTEADVPASVREAWAAMEPWRTRRVVRPMVPLDLFAAAPALPSSPLSGSND